MLTEASAAPCRVIVGSMVIGKAITAKDNVGRTTGLRPGIWVGVQEVEGLLQEEGKAKGGLADMPSDLIAKLNPAIPLNHAFADIPKLKMSGEVTPDIDGSPQSVFALAAVLLSATKPGSVDD